MSRRPSLKPSKAHRIGVWAGTGLLIVSGLLIVLPNWFPKVQGWGPWDTVQGLAAPIHGLLSFAFLVLGGTLSSHVVAGWKAGRNRTWGLAVLIELGLLALTAWGLYYLPPGAHELFSKLHLYLGLGLPALLVLHAMKGR